MNHMNEHCNNTHLPWNKSPLGIEFKRLGYQSFVPNVSLGGVTTQRFHFFILCRVFEPYRCGLDWNLWVVTPPRETLGTKLW